LKTATSSPVTSRLAIGQREHERPGEGHQLVVAEARQRAADPDEKKQDNSNFGRKPEQRQQNCCETIGSRKASRRSQEDDAGDRQRDSITCGRAGFSP
jgi:hypothetical protein